MFRIPDALMKISALLIFLALFPSFGHAEKSYYIKLGYVERDAMVWRVASALEKLGYSAFGSDENLHTVIYTGPFFSLEVSRRALGRIRKTIAPDAFIVVFSEENETSLPITKEAKTEGQKSLFAGISAGFGHLDIEKKERPVLHYDCDDTGIVYGAVVGYEIDGNFFTTLNYQHTRLDDIDLDDFFATINYRFDTLYTLSPFVGVLGGYSFMEWRKNPFDASRADTSSEGFIGGGQIGADAPIFENLRLFTLYRYIFLDHTTSISTNSQAGEIDHTSNQVIEMGIRYGF
ncbi:hypothetical protein [Hydrogenimonas urashimensis]|uniref:hypothetical protein n=1 Tax=Hydrogenimonas urashimensis TaxID=2740515 RepID=UPI001916A31F|nr:hypothetical protein [Hydrogenimonas urashimensis]